jgi:hypothetical protein
MADVSLAFNAVGRDRGVSALLTRTSNQVRAANARSAASTVALGAAMAFAAARALALASAATSAAGAAAAIPAVFAASASIIGAYKASTFGLAEAWKATGQAAAGGSSAASGAAQKAVRDARSVRDAEWALSDAKREAREATEALNKARKEEAERLEDVSRQLTAARTDELDATAAVAKAEQDLAVAKEQGSGYDQTQAGIALRKAQDQLAETKDRVKDLSAEQAKGKKVGVEGSDAVQEAIHRQTEAQRQLIHATEQLTDAQTQMGQAAAGATSGGIDPAAQALAKLSPNGRAVILTLRRLATGWQEAGRAGQQATFAGVAGDLERLSGIYLPRATSWLVRMGGAFNLAIRQSAGLATSRDTIRDVETFTNNTAVATGRLAAAVRPVLTGIQQWVAVGSGFLPELAGYAGQLANRFATWSVRMRESGQAASWIRTGITTTKQFIAIAMNLAHTILAVVRAGGDGGQTLSFLVRGSAALRKFVESAQGQAKIQQFFAVLRGALAQIGPLVSGVTSHGHELGQSLTIMGQSAQFAVDHLGPLLKYLPTLAAGYLLLKHSGIAAGVGLGVKAFQIASQFAMSRAIRAHTMALRENTIASRTAATATSTGTVAENAGILAKGRAVVAMIAQKAAMVASAAWTGIVTAAQWAWNVALSANPIGLIVLAIAAVVAAVVLLWKHSDGFRKFWIGAWSMIKHAALVVWSWVKSNWKLLLAILTGPIGLAVRYIAGHWSQIKAGAGAVKDWIVGKFTALTTWFGGLPSRIGKALKGLVSFFMAPWKQAFNAVAGLWNRTIGGMSFTVPSWVPAIGGNSFSLPRVPYLAKGGIVPATPGGRLVKVAEGGEDEIVAPLSKLGQVSSAAGGGGTARIWFDWAGAEREFAKWFRKALRTDALVSNAVGT